MDWSAQEPTYRRRQPGGDPVGAHPRAAPPERQLVRLRREFAGRRPRPGAATVAGVQIVAWRGADGGLLVAPRACPHLGADLSTAPVECGTLVCPWHGLRLSDRRHGAWKPFPAYDDGVLCWVRLDAVGGETPTDAPILSSRPGNPRVAAVSRLEGVCEPRDIVANRLDPWHGAWFHPYSFTRLEVLSAPAADDDLPEEFDRFLVAVTFQIGRLGVPVVAEFTTPGPRTVVMRIIDGEGQGSVVETHATPVGPRPRRPAPDGCRGSSHRTLRSTALRQGADRSPGDQAPDETVGDALVA